MDPLIITATPNVCWLQPQVDYPRTPAAMADEAARCREAGASILHMHADDWIGTIDAVRWATDLVVQCGTSSHAIPERMDVFRHGADMISIITSHHDEAFVGLDMHVLHPREELEEYGRLAREYGTRLEYEIWHTGSIWNLEFLIRAGAIDPPYFTSLFFGWPGGSWSPPTIEEYRYRRRHLPQGALATVSIMGAGQLEVLAAAITHGDHVRVGTEDQPFLQDGTLASTHELVHEVRRLAEAAGRRIATPDEARGLIGLAPAGRAAVP